MLKVEHVYKKLGNKQVLNDCSMEIAAGSIVGLIGLNGAGKSTLFRCISGIYQIDEGTITFEDQIIYENESVKKAILLLSDTLYYPNHATMKSMKNFYQVFYPTFNEVKYHELKALLKLDEDEPLKKFSKGMRKQAFLCIVLAMQPKLLILDEVFDGLDPMMRMLMKKALSVLVADTGASILISSHSLQDIENLCDHYIIMDHNTLQTSQEMDENNAQYHQFQLAFQELKTIDDFKGINIIDMQMKGKIITLVAQGDVLEIRNTLKALHPILMEEIELSLEEIFVSKVKSNHYTTEDMQKERS